MSLLVSEVKPLVLKMDLPTPDDLLESEVEYSGRTYKLKALCERKFVRVSKYVVLLRLTAGWTLEDAIFKKPKQLPATNFRSNLRGVVWHPGNKLWYARIYRDGKSHNLGYYETEVEAAVAYNLAAIKYHGTNAKLNEF